jgi:hypothetical protein
MSTAFSWAAGIGLSLLILATVMLVWMNRSEQVTSQLFAAAAIGTMSFVIAFGSSLRASNAELSFTTSIVEDMRSHLPLMVFPGLTLQGPAYQASRISMLAGGPFARMQGEPAGQPASLPEEDVGTRYLELIQALILQDLREITLGGFGVTQTLTNGGSTTSATLRQVPPLTNPAVLAGPMVVQELETNMFASSPLQRHSWEHMGIRLPAGSKLRIATLPSSPQTGPTRTILNIDVPSYLELSFTVTPLGSNGPGSTVEGVSVPQEIRNVCKAHHFAITARAHFPRLTSGSDRTEENKRWVQWVFSELERRFKGEHHTN